MRLVFFGNDDTDLEQIDLPSLISLIPAGSPGQVVGYDAQRRPVPIDPGQASLPPGQPGQVLAYDGQGIATPTNPTIPLATANW